MSGPTHEQHFCDSDFNEAIAQPWELSQEVVFIGVDSCPFVVH